MYVYLAHNAHAACTHMHTRTCTRACSLCFYSHQAVPLDCVSVQDLPDSPEQQNALMLRSSAKSFIAIADAPADKISWVNAINEQLPKGGGKPQAPLWTPDAHANACR